MSRAVGVSFVVAVVVISVSISVSVAVAIANAISFPTLSPNYRESV